MAPRITIVGGTDVISAQVANELTGRGYQVSRVAAGAAPGAGGGDTCSFQASLSQGLARQTLVVVNPAAPANLAVASSLAQSQGAPVLRVDPAAGLTDAAKEWLGHSAPALNATYIVDPDGTGIPAELERQITDLISGPLGAKSQNNPTVPALN
jgi:putative cell wall-binding protein